MGPWNCRISRLVYPKVRESKHIVRMPIGELQEPAQAIMGHGLFKHHIRHWNKIDDYQCAVCAEKQKKDLWHLWEWCPKLEQERVVIRKLLEQGLIYDKGILKMMRTKDLVELRATNEALKTV